MKALLPLTLSLLLIACTATSRNDIPLQVQAPGAPLNSSIGKADVIGAQHLRYTRQPNEVNNALWGGAIGAGIGQAAGHDTESTAYGFGAGVLGGYYSGFLY
ncbi:hypothetical protein [Cardiobacterium valvarum]|uniref:Glycine zipper 2TM domain-containing protein n=1 Tax=Cardiobacterium valvarum F0432 TaxID=797473 RepID=G9ZI82_9GAMM|nr:hypothetical protein [Cardiobacterium valvarum]EHM52118.1 hypothetical protein HMPREF9080_02492 [Cardiobacterium valvarum F0432]